MKWLDRNSPFHQFTNPIVINLLPVFFGHGIVIYFIHSPYFIHTSYRIMPLKDADKQVIC